ncbi:MAG: type II secretion system protein GspE [Candidatus Marinimicrobia bacterium]|nr:type II secretion system protein GspE [Candidatus Neomarinimicrobiota bacterium]|tara:strand:- start:1614 stop:3281 length:1668 start_codon:yes stop_codon:yes gene_type:complete
MAVTGKHSLGKLLIQAGKIDEDQLQKALSIQKEKDVYIGVIFRELGYLDERELNRYISQQLRIPYLHLGHYDVDKSVMDLIPERTIRTQKMLPLFRLNNTLNLAITDPLDAAPINAARDVTGMKIEPIIVTESEIDNAIDLYYGISGFVDVSSSDEEVTDISDLFDETRIVELVDSIITQSQRYRCSDIHIEPRENDIRVRFRIDGRLQDFQALPKDIHTALISRLKIMSNMDIAETRRPQDGRILFNSSQGRLDLRISTYPTLYGEKSVLRLLNISEALHSLQDLGFEPATDKKFNSMLVGGEGIILVSGPTGSGKTTTLYSTLNKLEKPDVNIVTVEDPIEYDLGNINQAQVNTKSGVTFASALRSILRQDPDIIMVGEIRDEETVELAIRAALTGHLVFSTIHTNDAASGFTRLLNWGVEPFLIASTVKGILAQRLVRRICKECRKPYNPTPTELKLTGLDPDKPLEAYKGKGCLACRNTGYKGRIGIYELLLMDGDISDLVLQEAPGYQIQELAHKNGMVTLLNDGVVKIERGDTTLSEVYETLGTTRIAI